MTTSSRPLNLRGILLPFTTPFTATEDLDKDALRANIQHWNQTGISGYVALGSTGERVNLNEREYLDVIETARDEVPDSMTFICGAGQQSTRQTINEIRQAANLGADGVLVITPNFYRAAMTPGALIEHYQTIADASPVPVVLYSMPDLTGIAIEPSTVATLSEHPNIIGMKDSSADIPRFQETLKVVTDGFAVLTGNGTVLFDALKSGARGAVLAVGCTAAEYCLEIYNYVQSGDLETGSQLQEKLTPLALAVTKRYGIGGLKAALDLSGLIGGSVRAPLKAPSNEARHEIEQLLNVVRERRSSRINSGDTSRMDSGGFAGVVRT